MKKILCVFVCILFLAGCGNQSTKEVENKIPDFYGFGTDVYTVVNDVKICAKAEYTSFDKLVLTFTSPETVKDMQIICKDGECEVNLYELSFLISNEQLPFNSLCVCLKSCAESIKSATAENGYYSFVSNGYKCKLYVDDETKHFQKLAVNETDILFFENFKYYSGQDE